MGNLNKAIFKFLSVIVVISLFLLIIGCDDSFSEKIETEKEIASIQNEDNDNSNQHDPEVFSAGNNGVIVIKYLADHYVRFKWHKARDKDSNPQDVTYEIYYSLENNINTVEDARLNGTLEFEGFNFNKYTINGLEDDTDYYINIVATDGDGNETIYSTVVVETVEEENVFNH